MREAGRLVAQIVAALKQQTQPGMTTADVDHIAADMMRAAGATSTALGYYGYPGSICVSVNDQVVHGIPGLRKLKLGDLVKVDVAARYRGYVGDTTASYLLGPPTAEVERLMRVAEAALWKGIEQARPGNRMGDISNAIQRRVE